MSHTDAYTDVNFMLLKTKGVKKKRLLFSEKNSAKSDVLTNSAIQQCE